MKKAGFISVLIFIVAIFTCSCGQDSESRADFTIISYAEKYCPFSSACESDDLSDCFHDLLANDDAFSLDADLIRKTYMERTNCLAKAKNCVDYYMCMSGVENKECEENFETHCENEVIVGCNMLNMIQKMDCSTFGQKCIEDYGGFTCGDDSYSCSSELEETCDGSKAFWCPGDYREHPIAIDCAAYGYECKNGMCADTGGIECEADKCNGQYLSKCYRNLQTTYDCSRVSSDFVCSLNRFFDGEEQSICQKAKSEWECDEEGTTCEGDIAKVCVGGKLLEIDCSKFDGATCNSDRCEILE